MHLHTHDTPGGQLATLLAAIDAGVDAVDAACAAVAGTTSQPALSALVSATDHSERETGLSLAAVNSFEPYWESVRRVYAPFESGLPAPTGRVYTHEIPGGQLSNLRQQAIALGLGEKFEQVEDMYAAADRHPRPHRQGHALLQGGRRPRPRPGRHRRGPGRVRRGPGPLRHPRLGHRLPATASSATRPAAGPSRSAPRRSRAAPGPRPPPSSPRSSRPASRARPGCAGETLNELLFPGPTKEFLESRETYGDLSALPTIDFLYGLRRGEEHEVTLEEGKTIIFGLQAIGDPDERGFRTVMSTINGQLRPVSVRDRAVSSSVATAEKADPKAPGQVAAPFQGVVTVVVAEGDSVAAGDTVATIEAMKMEASITAPVAGTVSRLAISGTQAVDGGDLVVVLS